MMIWKMIKDIEKLVNNKMKKNKKDNQNNLKPIISLINNDGYTIERVIVDHPNNDIQPWNYHKLAEVFGGTIGLDVHTEGELEDALSKAANIWSCIH